MGRLARIVLPGIPHHVTQRGNRGQATFFEDGDYRTYIAMLAEACQRSGTEVWAWCLMPNHVHLILVPPDEDGLRAAVADAHRRYTRYINQRQGWTGHLWQGRFFSAPMDEHYLLAAVRYVERNPVRAGLAAAPTEWPWSSARAHSERKPDGLTRLDALDGLVQDWADFWSDERDDPKTLDVLRRHVRTGRPLGADAFLKRAEKLVGRPLRRKKPGPKIR